MAIQHVRVEGSGYQRGFQYGRQALVTDADVGEPGLPYHVLLRAVLDCATVTDALAALQGGARSSSANYLVAHAHPDPADHPREQSQTVASLLMDLTAGQFWLAAGNPCQAPYEQLTVNL